MTAYTRRLLCIVPAVRQQQANDLAKQVDTAGGEQTFTAGLVPVGSPAGTTPTHYWCGWSLTTAEWNAIKSRLDTAVLRNAGVKFYDGLTVSPAQALADAGLEPTRSNIP